MRKSSRAAKRERFWLNGRFVSESGARVSVLDRGVLYGDALYEVVRFYRRKIFLLDEHLDRLFGEAKAIALPERFGREAIARAVRGLVARSEKPDGLVLLQWTRGEGPRRLAPPPGLRGTVFAVRLDLPMIPAALRRRGADVVTLPDERWLSTHLKSTNLLASVLARGRADEAGAHEAVLHRGRGPRARVTEATSSSFFLVKRGRLVTPAVRGLLPGITRSVVLAVAREEGIPIEERTVRLGEIREADEAFLTATSAEVLPIGRVNGASLRLPAPGPVTRRLGLAFARFRRRVLAKTPRIAPL
ncbi:MAG: aminotransferase class IV [Candidatus Eisenbacteria bacterium]|nr:aminotransferase class IV [Candidatus Eisenbacteria bacterium]